jgi:exodeoxyribonuclease V gamma subunit
MHVHRSNRTERLVDVLTEIVAPPLADPLAPEVIAVQGRGMERWLAMQLAQRFGVWGNPKFPFPRHLVQQLLRSVLGAETLDPRFEPESLRWAIAESLPRLLKHEEFVALRRYLDADASPFRLFQLAERIAQLFDQYVVYRPDMILRWEANEESHWQARLWRSIIREQQPRHMAACARDFRRALARHRGELPERVCLFGLSTLAPLYVEIFDALSTATQVHLFIVSPSREFWAQTRSRRETLRRLPLERPADDLDEILRQEAGNPLLASLGRLGREFQQVLEVNVEYQEDDVDLYVEPPCETMLETIQADMLTLTYRGAGGVDPKPVSPADDSVAVHACHSPMREVEVLHDQLRRLFESDRSLDPQDIVVMSPAIDEYAPLIEAVFGGAANEAHRIPYRIADRRLQATDEVVHAFLDVLTTMGTRVTASQVIDLLELDAVRDRFGIAATQLDDLRAWIKGAEIRWGIDAQHRQRIGQPPLESNTWRFGLDRLFLGFAMAGEGARLFGGVLPYDDIEGTGAAPLGALAELCDELFRFHRDFEQPRTVQRWCIDLEILLNVMIAADRWRAYQHQQIRNVLGDLAKQADVGGFGAEVDLHTMRCCLERGLDEQAPGRSFLTGGVTFCALVPMRTIPFDVVCLLGMNDDVFPRSRRPLGFDLMARKPRPGDRSPRDDDRYLFLEALLSARRKLIVTYVGQSVHDNAERPPSVVVSELLDAIDESFKVPEVAPPIRGSKEAVPEKQLSLFSPETPPAEVTTPFDELRVSGKGSLKATGTPLALSSSKGALGENRNAPGMSSRLVTLHPLQPFSPRYFRAGRPARLISYSPRHYEAAKALVAERDHVLSPFVPGPLPPIERAQRVVTVDQLTRFFENPARAFLQNRLTLALGQDVEMMNDREPIDLDNLEQWKVGTDLLKAALRGEDLAAARPGAIATGRLPPGTLGDCELAAIEAVVRAIAAAAARRRAGSPLEALEVDAMIGDTRLTGMIGDRWCTGYSQCQYSKIGSRRELSVWVRHLVLNWLADAGAPRESFLIGRGDHTAATVRFKPVGDAESLLRELVALYWYGLTVPLPLFARSSREYAARFLKALEKSGDEHDAHTSAISAALKTYDGTRVEQQADGLDPYVEQAFRNRHPLRDDAAIGPSSDVPARFSTLALAVYRPFFAHREVVE